MLKFKRSFKRSNNHGSIRTVIPPHRAADIDKAVNAIMDTVKPDKALAAIKPTKLFIKAKINGSSNPEAKALAGFSSQKPTKDILASPITKLILEEVLAQEEKFGDRGIVTRLKEMWDCKEEVYIPVGEHVVKRKKPNWDVRKFAFTNVLELRGYKGKKGEEEKSPQATEIHFHVSPVPGQTPISVDAQPIES